MDLNVRGKVFAIVGGASGMGFECARILAQEGARIGLIGRDREAGEARALSLKEEFGARVVMYSADGARPGSIEQAIEGLAEALGGLDGLAVTAGPMLRQSPLVELSDADWQDYFQAHVLLTVRACRAAIPRLQAAGGGTIVNVSAYSIHAQKPYLIAYTAMKSAVASITKNIAVTYGRDGIRANTVCPGFVATDAARPVMEVAAQKYGLPPLEAIDKALLLDYHMDVALGRVGRPHELGELLAFLLSSRAGYLTGALINCDGGTQF